MPYITNHPFISIIIIFSLAILWLAWLLLDLRNKWERVFGKKALPAEGVMQEAVQRLMRVESNLEIIEPRMDILERIGKASLQKVGFMRFNPFEDTGGDQSFAVALLDLENNGIVISSLYTREGVRTYAKEVKNGVSKHPLSEEEKKVLEQAIG